MLTLLSLNKTTSPSLWPYHSECAQSQLISEAKQGRTWLVVGWETIPTVIVLT